MCQKFIFIFYLGLFWNMEQNGFGELFFLECKLPIISLTSSEFNIFFKGESCIFSIPYSICLLFSSGFRSPSGCRTG